jgi:RNA polymerase sigma-70 factor (ECF subfamily)
MGPVELLATASGLPAGAGAAAAWTDALSAARDAWPTVTVDEGQLARFLGERLADLVPADGDLATALALAPVTDLAIATACMAQDPNAHAAFDAVLVEVDVVGATTRAPSDVVDDVKQVLRLQLLVPHDDKPPGIVAYRGRGPLRGWIRIIATRELLRHLKKRQREEPLPTLEESLGSIDTNPMLSQLKSEYRGEFASSLREAIGDLSAKDRTLLRQSIVYDLSIDAIGAAFGVHRATAARWLARAREALVEQTRTRLASRLSMTVSEIDSVISLVQSRLEASVVRYLRQADD